MFLSILIAAAAPAAGSAVAAPDNVVVQLVAGEGDRRCLPDKNLCFELAKADGDADIAGSLIVTSPTSGKVDTVSFQPKVELYWLPLAGLAILTMLFQALRLVRLPHARHAEATP